MNVTAHSSSIWKGNNNNNSFDSPYFSGESEIFHQTEVSPTSKASFPEIEIDSSFKVALPTPWWVTVASTMKITSTRSADSLNCTSSVSTSNYWDVDNNLCKKYKSTSKPNISIRANFLGLSSRCPEKAVSLHIGSVGRGGGWQDGDGGIGGGRAAKAARDVTGLSERGGFREACHNGDSVLITYSSVAGLLRKSSGARNRKARKARKGAKVLTISSRSHGWSRTPAVALLSACLDLQESLSLPGPNARRMSHTNHGWSRQDIMQCAQTSSRFKPPSPLVTIGLIQMLNWLLRNISHAEAHGSTWISIHGQQKKLTRTRAGAWYSEVDDHFFRHSQTSLLSFFPNIQGIWEIKERVQRVIYEKMHCPGVLLW